MKSVSDLRVLNKLSRQYGLKFDSKYKYLLNECSSLKNERAMRKDGYIIQYIDGCFYPFIFQI